ncbi:proline racemase family protein [Marinobacter sp. X15-166B]|uniref:proline racemase family protein n=1 Tax=Marinobacter sp. X15-166B TaxID=1897620 RepID=UPI00085C00F4|nr:proline racemase family protein [Marinobacter sp. X15-166B]OEY66944.1 proline racemase [Marinobacter sp. X15-166B]
MPATDHHAPSRRRRIHLIDMHAGGDVSRILVRGVVALPGDSVLAQMRYLQAHGDGLRRWLLNEPYGDPYMSVNLVVPPVRPTVRAGYITMEAMGYPLYSGSNTICTATALLENGLVLMEEGEQELLLESPAGPVRILVSNRGGRVESITARSEPAFVAAQGMQVPVAGIGRVSFDLVWSGAYFAMIDAGTLGFFLTAEEMPALAAFGRAFVEAARPQVTQNHPGLGAVGPLPFVHFMGPLGPTANGYRSPSATYVHPGVICRSPTGTGTSARLALLYEHGQLSSGQTLETVSPRGASFTGRLLGAGQVGGFPAVHSEITGRAWTLARSEVLLDLDDPLVDCTGLHSLLSWPA